MSIQNGSERQFVLILKSKERRQSLVSPGKTDRVALFVDGPNLHATVKILGFDIDYKRLLDEIKRRGTLVRALY